MNNLWKNKDLMLTLHNSSRKFIVDRIEKHKHQQKFLLTWHKCNIILRDSITYYDFHHKMMNFNNEVGTSALKKWWPTTPKYERIAIGNCCDIVNNLDKRFNNV